MPSPSLAQKVLDEVDTMRALLDQMLNEGYNIGTQTLVALMLALRNLGADAERRLAWSANERARRDQGTAGTVKAQGRPHD